MDYGQLIDKQCIAMDFLHVRNQSNNWGAIILIILLLAMFWIFWWVATASKAGVATKDLPEENWLNKLKWIIIVGFILIAIFILYSIYSTQQYFTKYGITKC